MGTIQDDLQDALHLVALSKRAEEFTGKHTAEAIASKLEIAGEALGIAVRGTVRDIRRGNISPLKGEALLLELSTRARDWNMAALHYASGGCEECNGAEAELQRKRDGAPVQLELLMGGKPPDSTVH